MKDVGAFPDGWRSEKPDVSSIRIASTSTARVYERHEYLPHRNPPSNSFSPPQSCERYTIVDRVPGPDSVPRYILRQNESQAVSHSVKSNTGKPPPLLRVTLYDIEHYVSRREIERFENRRYVTGEEDYSSPHEWMRMFKRAKKYGLGMYRKYPNVQVVVYQKKHFLEDDKDEATTSHYGTMKRRRLSVSGPTRPVMSLLPRVGDFPASLAPCDVEEGKASINGRREEAPEDDEEYEVARVVAHRDVMGLRWYLVTWVGHSDSEATWLSEEDLEDVKEAIGEYWDKQSVDEVHLWEDTKDGVDEQSPLPADEEHG